MSTLRICPMSDATCSYGSHCPFVKDRHKCYDFAHDPLSRATIDRRSGQPVHFTPTQSPTVLYDYQARVIAERADLVEKLSKLSMFINTPAAFSLKDSERRLLRMQLNAMELYSHILQQRIEGF